MTLRPHGSGRPSGLDARIAESSKIMLFRSTRPPIRDRAPLIPHSPERRPPVKVSSIRLDRYAAIAAYGSSAVGVAVSPLHADIQYFGSSSPSTSPGHRARMTRRPVDSGGGCPGTAGFQCRYGPRLLDFLRLELLLQLLFLCPHVHWLEPSPRDQPDRQRRRPDRPRCDPVRKRVSHPSLRRSFCFPRYLSIIPAVPLVQHVVDRQRFGTGPMSPGQRASRLGFELDGETVFGGRTSA